jgi:hypothetical protein
VKNNASLMVAKVNFEFFLWCEFIHISFLYVAYVGNSPCTNQICTCAKHFCVIMLQPSKFVKDSSIFIIRILPQNMFPMFSKNSKIWLPTITTKCIRNARRHPWISMSGLCGLHFLSYLFKCPWWKDSSVPRHFYYACGCYKSLLFMFENYVKFHIWIFSIL